MKLKALAASIGLLILGLVASAGSFAHSKAELDASAAKTLKHFYKLNPANRGLVDGAVGVLVFSRVTKGGAGVAGEFGEGVLQLKGESVNYYSVGSASIGLTLGVARHSEIILFMTQEALNRFTASDGWSVGADTAVAVVSEGAGGNTIASSWVSPSSRSSSVKRVCWRMSRWRVRRSRRSKRRVERSPGGALARTPGAARADCPARPRSVRLWAIPFRSIACAAATLWRSA